MLRYLRRDDEQRKYIRLSLLKADLITNDLIPIIKTLESETNNEIFDVILRLLVNLTQPAILFYDLKVPENIIEKDIFNKIDRYLQSSKIFLTDRKFLEILVKKFNNLLNENWDGLLEEDEIEIERILILFRNILYIKMDDENLLIQYNDKLLL